MKLLLLPLAAIAVLAFSAPADAAGCSYDKQQSTEKPTEKKDKSSV